MITQAATKIVIDGLGERIIPLHRHGDLWKILKAFGFAPHKGYSVIEEGFIDAHGHFYSRERAAEIVKALGRDIGERLFSEDLY